MIRFLSPTTTPATKQINVIIIITLLMCTSPLHTAQVRSPSCIHAFVTNFHSFPRTTSNRSRTFSVPTCVHKSNSYPAITRRLVLRALSLLPFCVFPPPAHARCLPPDAVKSALDAPFPETWPYNSYDFSRYDKSVDSQFYAEPRITRHIDNNAVDALKAYYATKLLPSAVDILDLCTSVESYVQPSDNYHITGLGMNEVEMSKNPALESFVVHDLNEDPRLPYPNDSFDLVLCALSIDYLTRPREVLQQICRVLRPGGRVAISFSDRVFATKAVALWMSGGDVDHLYTVASFIHFAGGFGPLQVVDLSPRRRDICTGDPLYVVTSTKS